MNPRCRQQITQAMKEKVEIIETLLEEATDYAETSIELIRLKVVDKTADVFSSFIPHVLVLFLLAFFLLLLNLGLAFWLGEIIGETSYGFFTVGAFYGIVALLIQFFLQKRLKRKIGNYIINLLLN